jgi:hypothetical protein
VRLVALEEQRGRQNFCAAVHAKVLQVWVTRDDDAAPESIARAMNLSPVGSRLMVTSADISKRWMDWALLTECFRRCRPA